MIKKLVYLLCFTLILISCEDETKLKPVKQTITVNATLSTINIDIGQSGLKSTSLYDDYTTTLYIYDELTQDEDFCQEPDPAYTYVYEGIPEELELIFEMADDNGDGEIRPKYFLISQKEGSEHYLQATGYRQRDESVDFMLYYGTGELFINSYCSDAKLFADEILTFTYCKIRDEWSEIYNGPGSLDNDTLIIYTQMYLLDAYIGKDDGTVLKELERNISFSNNVHYDVRIYAEADTIPTRCVISSVDTTMHDIIINL